MTKIFISGGPGSGKTTYAKKLSKELNIPHFDFDDIKWINEKNCFNCEHQKKKDLHYVIKFYLKIIIGLSKVFIQKIGSYQY